MSEGKQRGVFILTRCMLVAQLDLRMRQVQRPMQRIRCSRLLDTAQKSREMNRNDRRSSDEERRTIPLRCPEAGSAAPVGRPKTEPPLFPDHVELNVGGKLFETTVATLTRLPNNLLEMMFTGRFPVPKDANGRFFIDRDGETFAHVLNFLRTRTLAFGDEFRDLDALMREAEYYQIGDLRRLVQSHAASVRRLKTWKPASGHISLHARANFAMTAGRNAVQVEHPFRKVQRIFVCGKVSLCQEVFEKDLNETRESNTNTSRYSNRFYLRHNQLEKAFDKLREQGFRLISSDGDGVGAPVSSRQPGMEGDWSHFSIFVFFRR